MRHHRMRLVGALGVMLGAAVPTTLDAQTRMPWQERQPAVEGYYTRLRLDADGSPAAADGIGGRLMWSATRPEDAGTSWLADRAAIGLLASHTPARNRGFSTLHLGAVVDVQPVPTPLFGRVTPYVSLAAGALRTTLSSDAATSSSPPRSPLTDRDNTTATLAPGVGARVMLLPGIALQGDLRDVMTFRHDTRHNVAFATGLRFTR